MQDESAEMCSVPARLARLRITLQANWGDVAKTVGLSESMLYQARSGKRTLSPKALYRLAAAETAAGIETPLRRWLSKEAPDDEMGALMNRFKDGEWNEDLDAQFAALMGQGILGPSVLTSWSVLEDFLGAFFDKVQKSANSPKSLAAYIAEEIPTLRKQMGGFGFELERFVECAKKDSNVP